MNYIDDWLILAQSHQLAVWHRDVVLAHMKKKWVTAKCQEKCAFSITEDRFPGRDMGLNVDAGTPVTGTYSVHPVSCKKYKGGRTPDAQCRAASRRAMSFKFEHIVFYVCTHNGGTIRRLSAAPSNDSERCSNSYRTTGIVYIK